MRMRGPLTVAATKGVFKKLDFDFDIVHAHFTFPAGYVGMKIKEERKKPLVLTAHGGDIYKDPFKNKKWIKLTKDILYNSDRIITTSLRNRNIIVELLGTEFDKVSVIRNGFDEKSFYPMEKVPIRQKLFLPDNKKIILSIGNLKESKGT